MTHAPPLPSTPSERRMTIRGAILRSQKRSGILVPCPACRRGEVYFSRIGKWRIKACCSKAVRGEACADWEE